MKRKLFLLSFLLLGLTSCVTFTNDPAGNSLYDDSMGHRPEQEQEPKPENYAQKVKIENENDFHKITLSFRNGNTDRREEYIEDPVTELTEQLFTLNDKNDPKHILKSIDEGQNVKYGQQYIGFKSLKITLSDEFDYEYVGFNCRAYFVASNSDKGTTVASEEGMFEANGQGYYELSQERLNNAATVKLTNCLYKLNDKTLTMKFWNLGYLENIEFYCTKVPSEEIPEVVEPSAYDESELISLPSGATLKGSLNFDIDDTPGERGNYKEKESELTPEGTEKITLTPNIKYETGESTFETEPEPMPTEPKIGTDINYDIKERIDHNKDGRVSILDETTPIVDYSKVAVSESSWLIKNLTIKLKADFAYEYVEIKATPYFLREEKVVETSEGSKTEFVFTGEDGGLMVNKDEAEPKYINLKLNTSKDERYPTFQSCVYKITDHEIKIEALKERIKVYEINFY